MLYRWHCELDKVRIGVSQRAASRAQEATLRQSDMLCRSCASVAQEATEAPLRLLRSRSRSATVTIVLTSNRSFILAPLRERAGGDLAPERHVVCPMPYRRHIELEFHLVLW